MTSTASGDMTVPSVERRPQGVGAVRLWLAVVAALVVAIVVVGGATRLTHSGLSITEWKPVHGVIPPLNANEWQEEFLKYQQIPEYQQLNRGMSLAEFQGIFWWEWAHRLLGRVIGFALFLPLVVFWLRGQLGPAMKARMVAILALTGAQGAVGWWMVSSGLAVRTDVSQYRLAIHLTLACAIYATVLWVWRSLAPAVSPAPPHAVRGVASVIVLLAVVQIFLGGVVAGLDAGLTFNTWPLMDGHLLPPGLFLQSPWWRNLFENALTVQFDHRLGAYLLFALSLFHVFQAGNTASARSALLLSLVVAAQAALGISTLITMVPLPLALLHQLGAIAVLGVAVVHRRAMSPPLQEAGVFAR